MKIECRQMRSWPNPVTEHRIVAPFGGWWEQTLQKLEREVEHLGGTHVVIEVSGPKVEIRRDGWPSARSVLDAPVLISFDSDHGSLVYGTDRYETWKENVHAVALGLERLRAIDRYGISTRGEQYKGWAALPMATTSPSAAVELLAKLIGWEVDVVRADPGQAVKLGRKKAHPDIAGEDSHDLFLAVQAAARALGVGS